MLPRPGMSSALGAPDAPAARTVARIRRADQAVQGIASRNLENRHILPGTSGVLSGGLAAHRITISNSNNRFYPCWASGAFREE